MPESTHEVICLRRRDLGENDAIVTLFSREAGCLDAVAKGVRRPRSKLAAGCQLYCWSRVQLAAGRNLATVTQLVVHDSFFGLRENLVAGAVGTYLCELTDRCLPETEPHAALFDLLRESLAGLAGAADPTAPQHSYVLRLLAELGYEPVLDRCARSGGSLGDAAVFCPAAGGLIRGDLREVREEVVSLDPRTVRAMRRLARPAEYAVDLGAVVLPRELEAELRRALRTYLRVVLEVEPKSAAFLDELLT